MTKIHLFTIGLLFCFWACKPSVNTEKMTNNSEDSLENFYSEYDEEANFLLHYVVSAAHGYNYDSLRHIAQEVSMLLHWELDSLGRYYNADQKKIIVPEDSDDEVWAGEYLFRRYGEDFVSIEMQSGYIEVAVEKDDYARDLFYQDTTKMFVCAGIFTEEKSAKAIANKIKEICPNVSIIPSELYMGCMH